MINTSSSTLFNINESKWPGFPEKMKQTVLPKIVINPSVEAKEFLQK